MALNSGQPGSAVQLMRRWVRVFEEYDAVVGDSGSCTATVHHQFPRVFEGRWRQRAEEVANRTRELTQFLAEHGASLELALAGDITRHDSCHMLRSLGGKASPREVLARVRGLRLHEATDKEVCCGFGGTFALMLMRGKMYPLISGYPERDRQQAHHRYTPVMEARPWEFPVWWFVACLSMPSGVRFGYTLNLETEQPEAVSLSCPDGSWCEVSLDATRDSRKVWEDGPVSLWSAVEQARDIWSAHGRPEWSRLGLTVTDRAHVVWVDSLTGLSWALAS